MDQLGPVIRINLFTIYCSINAFYYMYILYIHRRKKNALHSLIKTALQYTTFFLERKTAYALIPTPLKKIY